MSDETTSELTRLLRAGDPATGDPGLGAAERAAIRQRLLAAHEGRRPATGWLLPAATAAALLALTLGLAWRSATPTVATRVPPPPATRTERQVQFTTASGTLVVWVLQPRQTS